MFKMLLVEDEPVTMEGIKSAINWSLLDISICGEATNGLEAIPLIHELLPDIILCDIRMPKMDGISFIHEIQPLYPNIKVIFLSGYSDKEYLKKAIRLNVIDYIYKPFELGELIQAIEKAKAACIKDHPYDQIAADNNIALNLLEYSNKGWISTSDLRDIPINLNDYLATMVLRFNPNLKVTHETETLTISHYLPAFQQVFTQIFGEHYVISHIDNGYIVHANVSVDFPQHTETVSRLNHLFSLVGDSPKCLSIGISSPVESSQFLKDTYLQARTAVLSAFLMGYGKLIFYKDLNTTPFIPSADLESLFFNQIDTNNMASALDFLEEYTAYMRLCRSEDIPAIKDELAKIAFRLHQKLQKKALMQQKYVIETINYALDISEIKQYLFQLLDQILTDMNNLDNKGRIIFDVEKFILQNYDQDLSIKKIAEHVYITPTYLCHLYKKNTGRTLNHFLLEVKMNKSKQLIINTKLKLSEIAERLGYTNQNYFTKTFTKYFGVNPSTFRNKRL